MNILILVPVVLLLIAVILMRMTLAKGAIPRVSNKPERRRTEAAGD